jgi:hypothetical protein
VVAGFVDSVLSNVTVFRCSDVAFSNSKGGERTQDLRNCLVHAPCPSAPARNYNLHCLLSCSYNSKLPQHSIDIQYRLHLYHLKTRVFNQGCLVHTRAQFRHSLTWQQLLHAQQEIGRKRASRNEQRNVLKVVLPD